MPATDLTIEEISGADPMRIALRGRALPYQGLDFRGSQRTNRTWYPGNPKATQQVLGETLDDSTMHGTWKQKFLGVENQTDYEVSGGGYFEGPLASENLVVAFETLRARGVQIRMTWGSIIRYGLLKDFRATWAREEDVEWEATFEWNGTTELLVRSGEPVVLGSTLIASVQGMDDAAVQAPTDLDFVFATSVTAVRRRARSRALNLLGSVRTVLQRTQNATTMAQKMVSQATYLAADGVGLVSLLRNQSYVKTSLLDDVASVLRIEVWRLRLSSEALGVAASGAKEATATENAYKPPAQEVVVVRQRTTLRQLALSAYGDADAWTQIAAANHLQTSVVEAGTQLVIPARAQPPVLDTGVL